MRQKNLTKKMIKHRRNEGHDCPVIQLDDDEKNIYSGCGWHIAAFRDNKLIGLHNVESYPWIANEKFGVTVERATKLAVDKAKQFVDDKCETWLVMCSGYELCEPVAFAPIDALGVAKVARTIGDALEERIEADEEY